MIATATCAVYRTASILLFALAAASCGADQNATQEGAAPPATASPAAAARDACALITADEAAKILGSAVKMTPRSPSADRSACDYVTDAYESFTLEVVSGGVESHLEAARTAAKIATSLGGGQDQVVTDAMALQRVDNLGDEAYFSRRTTAYVRKGDVLLAFQTAGLNEPAREHWEALARAALARL